MESVAPRVLTSGLAAASDSGRAAGPARYSLVAVVALAVVMVIARLLVPYWDTRSVQAILTWDAMGYYLYLPAHFIYGDLRTLAFIPKILAEYNPTTSFYQAFQVPGAPVGHLVMKYPIGQAILEAPFFAIGHWLARVLGYPGDGFSAPYQISIAFGGLAYGLVGLGVLRRILLRYFTDLITALTLVLLVLGTNYFQYAVFDAAMTHTSCFTLYAVLLACTIRWHAAPRLGWALGLGLALGLLVIVRPSEMVAVLLPVLWGVSSVASGRAKLALVQRYWRHVALAAAVGLLAVSPQLLYWKWATGHWVFNSYQEQGFSWLRPHLRAVVFSFRKGWLIYTPLMVLALVGFRVLWRNHRGVAVPVMAYAAVNLWVVAAWDVWWYGGSIGCRALVQSYAVLSLPLAALLAQWPGTSPTRGRPAGAGPPPWRTVLAWPVLALLVGLNLFQHWQYMAGIIVPEDMTASYWRAIFLKAKPTQADYARLDVAAVRPGLDIHWQLREAGKQTFDEVPADQNGALHEGLARSTAYRLTPDKSEFSPALEVSVAALQAAPGAWLRWGGNVYSDWGAWGALLVLEIRRGDKALHWHAVRLHNNGTPARQWSYVFADLPLPADLQPTDVVRVFGWAPGGAASCLLDDVKIEVAARR